MKGMKRIPQEEIEEKDKKGNNDYIYDKIYPQYPSIKKLGYITLVIIILILAKNKLNILIFRNSSTNLNSTNTANKSNENTQQEDSEEDKKSKVRLALYVHSLNVNEMEKLTTILINHMSKQRIFDIYLFINKDCKNEFKINKTVHRIKINIHSTQVLRRKLIDYKIEMFLYQFYSINDMKMLNQIADKNNIRTLIIGHSSFLSWIYNKDFNFFSKLYNFYKQTKYIVSSVAYESDLLHKKWGINSIFMNNIMPYEYNNITPSDLSSKTILMVGKGSNKLKRFDLGIKAMKYIVKEIPDCEMKIISDFEGLEDLKLLTKELNLENNIKFEEYTSSNDIYYKNASLHLLTSVSESDGLILCETKLFGIPNILTGLDYLTCSKNGTVTIYNDNPENIAQEAIKILKDEKYKKNLGKKARESMKQFDNSVIADKWLRLILSVYLDDSYYERIKDEDKELINKKENMNNLKTQVNLLKMRIDEMKSVTVDDIMNFDYMKKLYKLKKDNNYFKGFF